MALNRTRLRALIERAGGTPVRGTNERLLTQLEGLSAGGSVPSAARAYVLTYDANGGEGTVPSQQGVIAGLKYGLPRPSLTKGGEPFRGWSLTPDGPVITDDVEFTGNTTVYAVYGG